MNLKSLIPIFLFIGAFFHVIQGFLFGFNETTTPVVIWGVVLAFLGYFWTKAVVPNWTKWVTLIMPIVGGTGLFMNLAASTNPAWIDYSILGLDVVTVLSVAYLMFLKK